MVQGRCYRVQGRRPLVKKKMVQDAAMKVSYCARTISHGARKVSKCVRKVSCGARKVSNGARKVSLHCTALH